MLKYGNYYSKHVKTKTCENSAKDVETAVPLKYLSKFWRILKMSLINSEIDLILTWSGNCFIFSNPAAIQTTKFAITYIKLFIQLVILSTQRKYKAIATIKRFFVVYRLFQYCFQMVEKE